jgi:hypothetical protein
MAVTRGTRAFSTTTNELVPSPPSPPPTTMMPRAAVAHVLRVSSSHRHTNAIRLLSSTSSSSSTPLADAEQLQHQPNRQLIEACENLDIEQVVHSLNAGADPYTTTDAPAPPLVVSLYDHTRRSMSMKATILYLIKKTTMQLLPTLPHHHPPHQHNSKAEIINQYKTV